MKKLVAPAPYRWWVALGNYSHRQVHVTKRRLVSGAAELEADPLGGSPLKRDTIAQHASEALA